MIFSDVDNEVEVECGEAQILHDYHNITICVRLFITVIALQNMEKSYPFEK